MVNKHIRYRLLPALLVVAVAASVVGLTVICNLNHGADHYANSVKIVQDFKTQPRSNANPRLAVQISKSNANESPPKQLKVQELSSTLSETK